MTKILLTILILQAAVSNAQLPDANSLALQWSIIN